MSMPSLRTALLLDALASGGLGLLLALGADLLAPLLALPAGLLRGAGIALIPWAGLVLALGLQAAPARLPVRLVIGVNLLWVAASLLVLLLGPSALGFGFVLAQALAVAVFAELQVLGLRREAAA